MNIVELSGRLTREPEMRFLGQGYPVLEMNLAVDDGFGRWNKESKKTEVGSGFYQVEVFGNYAEQLVEDLEKGSEVYVKGSLTQWTKEKEDGTKESKTRIRGEVVVVRGAPRQQAQRTQAPAQQDPWQASPAAQQGGRGYSEEPPF